MIPGQSKAVRKEKKPVAPQGQKRLNLISPKESKREVVHGNRPRHVINTRVMVMWRRFVPTNPKPFV